MAPENAGPPLLRARDSRDIFISAGFTQEDLVNGICAVASNSRTARNARGGKTKRNMPGGDPHVHSDFGHSEFYRIGRVCTPFARTYTLARNARADDHPPQVNGATRSSFSIRFNSRKIMTGRSGGAGEGEV